jgi:hypothetical protein
MLKKKSRTRKRDNNEIPIRLLLDLVRQPSRTQGSSGCCLARGVHPADGIFFPFVDMACPDRYFRATDKAGLMAIACQHACMCQIHR